ncbi:hypothetical protein G7A79_28050, partial [Coprococcus sp. MSK.21.13]|nr:hypothetical protein [Coprococcus sp. MSK.21.13]
MKKKSIAFQIWSVIAGVLIIVFISLGILVTVFINSFFTEEVYETIEYSQENILSNNMMSGLRKNNYDYDEKFILKQDIRSVNNIIYPYKGIGMLRKL